MEYVHWGEIQDEWSTLIHTIRNNKCILLLGPEVSSEQINGQSRPLTEILANELAEKISPEIKQNINPSNLVQVAQYYEIERGSNNLEAKVCGFYEERWNQTSEIHRDLAALPFYFTIVSTPDNMFCTALREAKKEPVIEYYNFKGETPEVQDGTVENPLVFYLYGTIDEPESLVLTEENLIVFLTKVISENPALPINILSELHNEDKSLLFLGFGFKHWYLRILLHVLQGHGKRSDSYALEQCTPEDIDEFQETILFFKKSGYRITICGMELKSFVQELRERYERHATGKRRPGVKSSKKISEAELQDAPTVFLCHSKQNRDDAEYLRDRLREAGFNAWFDEDDLRGGDEWDRKIERAIKKEIDYFVVLQSNVMTTKLESYFNKEIRLALERQNYFRPGIRFIVPTKVEDCPLVEELEHLQTIDLSDKENIKKLISTLKKDQQRRNKK